MPDPVLDEAAQVLSEAFARLDWQALFTALPEEEFRRMIEDRRERIDERRREVHLAEDEIARMEREVEAFQTALEVKRQLEHPRNARPAESQPETPSMSRAELMGRKRAAIMRVIEADPGRLFTPEDVQRRIVERGVLTEAEVAAGTPIRVVMAKLKMDGRLERPEPGRYNAKLSRPEPPVSLTGRDDSNGQPGLLTEDT